MSSSHALSMLWTHHHFRAYTCVHASQSSKATSPVQPARAWSTLVSTDSVNNTTNQQKILLDKKCFFFQGLSAGTGRWGMSDGTPAAASPAAAVPKRTRELLFAVCRFLEGGPCTEAATVLRREIEQNEVCDTRSVSVLAGCWTEALPRLHTKRRMNGVLLSRSV